MIGVKSFGYITHWTNRTIRKNGFHAIVDQGIISGMNFISFLVLARWFESIEFGQYILTFSALVFIQTIQHALITRAHNILGAKTDRSEFSLLTRSVIKLVLGFSAVIAVLCVLLALVFDALAMAMWSESAIALSIVTIPWMLQDALRRILYTSERIAGAAVNDGICYGLQLLAIVLLFQVGVPSSEMLVFSILGGSSLIAAVFGLYQVRHTLGGFFSDHLGLREISSRLWHFGKWLTTGEFIGWIGQNGNAWIIGALMGAPIVAGYRAATYVTNLLNPIDLSVANYLPVKAAKILKKEGKSAMLSWLWGQAIRLSIPYTIVVAGISLGSGFLLNLFFDDRYATGLFAVVLSISALSRLLGFISNFARIGLMASENNRPIMISQILSLVIFITIGFLLISTLGVTGAPLSRVILNVMVGGYLFHSLRKTHSKSINTLKTVTV